ncbi:MAG: response regulator [Alphaproteobacteria bacterium]
MILEDNESEIQMIRTIMRSQFSDANFKIAEHGREFLELVAVAPEIPDMIILDINTPGMNGFDVLKLMRECSDFNAIPIVMFSTSDTIGERVKAEQFGADGYVKKPSEEEFGQAIKRIVNDFINVRQEYEKPSSLPNLIKDSSVAKKQDVFNIDDLLEGI